MGDACARVNRLRARTERASPTPACRRCHASPAAALVEQMAAAASSMRNQAQDLVQAVAVFKLGQPRLG